MTPEVTVVGAGLAGCEAAWVLARKGVQVDLLDMKPQEQTPAHSLPGPAELVCSNSLKSDSDETAHGLLKAELRDLGSLILEAAEAARVPAGSALAVDRQVLSERVEALLVAQPTLQYLTGARVDEPPAGQVILATGPLTASGLVEWLRQRIGGEQDLYFYDALAPIVSAESIDLDVAFAASRWGKGGDDYLNCPFDESQYRAFVEALRAAERTRLHDFEQARYFESCLPAEVLADRGDDVLAFGPMRPVGLEHEGKRPFAVVHLRSENKARSAFNLVGFQTKLTRSAQAEVFRSIPGLGRAEFLRYGAVHRNLYVNSPQVLGVDLGLRSEPRVRLAGQITGVEGYMESAAMGLLVGLWTAASLQGRAFTPPPADTAIGALYAHVRGTTGAEKFEPMNIHFGLLPPVKARGRKARRLKAIERARDSFAAWLSTGLAGEPNKVGDL
jgi:methylenetetrahydrofolate--tRNA-(uracil-5-)-methyltransferase